MDQYFRYEAVRQRLRVGPLSDYFDSFALQLSEFGYAIDSGQQQLRAVARLSRWMIRRRLRAKDLDEQVAAEVLRLRRRRRLMRNIEPKTLALLLEHLRQDGVVARPPRTSRGTRVGESRAIFSATSSRNEGWRRRRLSTTCASHTYS